MTTAKKSARERKLEKTIKRVIEVATTALQDGGCRDACQAIVDLVNSDLAEKDEEDAET